MYLLHECLIEIYRLYDACHNGDYEAARRLLERNAYSDFMKPSALGCSSPMIECARKGYIDIAKLLIKYGDKCVINGRRECDDVIPLHHAAANNNFAFSVWISDSDLPLRFGFRESFHGQFCSFSTSNSAGMVQNLAMEPLVQAKSKW